MGKARKENFVARHHSVFQRRDSLHSQIRSHTHYETPLSEPHKRQANQKIVGTKSFLTPESCQNNRSRDSGESYNSDGPLFFMSNCLLANVPCYPSSNIRPSCPTELPIVSFFSAFTTGFGAAVPSPFLHGRPSVCRASMLGFLGR